ncbi:NFACT family protein, partial [bacterium]|nr:NFACT family protein [bacterium]
MEAGLTAHLAGEIAPRVAGARIRRTTAEGPGVIVLELAGHEHAHLIIAVDKALPLIAISPKPVRTSTAAGRPDARLERELNGAVIRGIRALPDRAAIEIALERQNPVGLSTTRTVLVELGRKPSITVGPDQSLSAPDTPDRNRGSGDGTAAAAASVSERRGTVVEEWTDNDGRPHARILSRSRSTEDEAARNETAAKENTESRPSTHARPVKTSTHFESANEAALHAFSVIFTELGPSRRREALTKSINQTLRRKKRAVTKVTAEIEDAAGADEYRMKGQLILARKSDIRRGATSADLVGYDGGESVVVEIDPRLTPQANAEVYFRKAKKAEKRGARAPERLATLEEEIAELEALILNVQTAEGTALDRMEERLLPPVRARGQRA